LYTLCVIKILTLFFLIKLHIKKNKKNLWRGSETSEIYQEAENQYATL